MTGTSRTEHGASRLCPEGTVSLGAGFPSMISLDMGEDPKGKRKMSMALRAGSSSSELGPGAGQREAVRAPSTGLLRPALLRRALTASCSLLALERATGEPNRKLLSSRPGAEV